MPWRLFRRRTPPADPCERNGLAVEAALRAAQQRFRDAQRQTVETDRFAAEIERSFRLRRAA